MSRRQEKKVYVQRDQNVESAEAGLSLTLSAPGIKNVCKMLPTSGTRGLFSCHLQQSAFTFGISISFTNVPKLNVINERELESNSNIMPYQQ